MKARHICQQPLAFSVYGALDLDWKERCNSLSSYKVYRAILGHLLSVSPSYLTGLVCR